MTRESSRLLPLAFLFGVWIVAFVLFKTFGCPGLLKGPWTLDQMAAFKHKELIAYGGAMVFVPLFAHLFVVGLDKLPPFLERIFRHPLVRLKKFMYLVCLPAILPLLLLQFNPPNFLNLIGWPILGLSFVFALLLMTDVFFPKNMDYKTENLSKISLIQKEIPFPRFGPTQRFFFYFLLPLLLFLLIDKPGLDGSLFSMDESLRVAVANQIDHGKKPYRDIFFQYGPGTEIVQPRLAFAMFGKTLVAQRRLEWLLSPTGYVALYFLALLVFRAKMSLFLLLLVILTRPDFWISPRSTLALLIFLGVLLTRYEISKKLKVGLLIFGGVLSGVAFFYSMESGLFSPLVVLLFLVFNSLRQESNGLVLRSFFREGGLYALGLLFSFLPAFVWLLKEKAFFLFIENFVLVGSTFLSGLGKPTPILCAPMVDWVRNPLVIYFSNGSWQRWWLPLHLNLILLTYLTSALFYRRSGKFDAGLALLAFCGTIFFTLALGRSDYEHWLKGTPTFWLLVLLVIEKGFYRLRDVVGGCLRVPSRGRFLMSLFYGSLWLAGLCFVLVRCDISRLIHSFQFLGNHMKRFITVAPNNNRIERLGDIQVTAQESLELKELMDRLGRISKKGDSVYVFTDVVFFYFLADVVNPTRYALRSYIIGDRMIADTIESLKRDPPECIVAEGRNGGLNFVSYQQPLVDFILSRYKIVDRYKRFVFLEPKK